MGILCIGIGHFGEFMHVQCTASNHVAIFGKNGNKQQQQTNAEQCARITTQSAILTLSHFIFVSWRRAGCCCSRIAKHAQICSQSERCQVFIFINKNNWIRSCVFARLFYPVYSVCVVCLPIAVSASRRYLILKQQIQLWADEKSRQPAVCHWFSVVWWPTLGAATGVTHFAARNPQLSVGYLVQAKQKWFSQAEWSFVLETRIYMVCLTNGNVAYADVHHHIIYFHSYIYNIWKE